MHTIEKHQFEEVWTCKKVARQSAGRPICVCYGLADS